MRLGQLSWEALNRHFIGSDPVQKAARALSLSTGNRYFVEVSAAARSGHLQMIDLSPQPQDKKSGSADLHPGPRHDPTTAPLDRKMPGDASRWQFPHEGAEAAIQLLSRWAGPAALIVALIAIGWLLLR